MNLGFLQNFTNVHFYEYATEKFVQVLLAVDNDRSKKFYHINLIGSRIFAFSTSLGHNV